MSVFGVILDRIFPHSDWIGTRITPNTETVHTQWYSLKAPENALFLRVFRGYKMETLTRNGLII